MLFTIAVVILQTTPQMKRENNIFKPLEITNNSTGE
jgi:hypothetical protein